MDSRRVHCDRSPCGDMTKRPPDRISGVVTNLINLAWKDTFSVNTFTLGAAGCAVFDETNLVSRAGLIPVVELTEQAGVSQHLDDHVRSGNCMTARSPRRWYDTAHGCCPAGSALP